MRCAGPLLSWFLTLEVLEDGAAKVRTPTRTLGGGSWDSLLCERLPSKAQTRGLPWRHLCFKAPFRLVEVEYNSDPSSLQDHSGPVQDRPRNSLCSCAHYGCVELDVPFAPTEADDSSGRKPPGSQPVAISISSSRLSASSPPKLAEATK